MDNTIQQAPLPQKQSSGMFSDKNGIIIILIFLLIFSFLGINLISILGDFIERIVKVFAPFISRVLSTFGYTTGTVIGKTADVVGDASKTGIDLAEGAAHSLGDLFIKISNSDGKDLDSVINTSPVKVDEPKPDKPENPIQKPITSGKTQWCLVGEYEGRRGCIDINEHDKCLSGQVFPSQKMCLNPTFTSNMPLSLKPIRE
jgi:hypothetical protein